MKWMQHQQDVRCTTHLSPSSCDRLPARVQALTAAALPGREPLDGMQRDAGVAPALEQSLVRQGISRCVHVAYPVPEAEFGLARERGAARVHAANEVGHCARAERGGASCGKPSTLL